jgi:hypothetical protein
MFTAILSWLGSLLGGPFARAAVDAYRAKLEAGNTRERIAADMKAKEIELDRREAEVNSATLIAEQGRWYTAIVRPLGAAPIVIYLWKVIVWDKVLGLGTTDPIEGAVAQWVGVILAAYFGGRSLEKAARSLRR